MHQYRVHQIGDFMSRFAHECIRRHGRRGFGRFAGGFADDLAGDGSGFRSGRKLSSEDLQLVILSLMEQKPRHGYEIIKTLDELSNGFYVPSPGVVYPSLTFLEEAGYAAVEAEGSRKLYRLTAEGRSHLARHRDAIDATIAQIRKVASKMERVRQALAEGERGRGGRHRHRRHRDDFNDTATAIGRAREALKSALLDMREATAEEEARIAEILDRAAAEIRTIQSKGII